MYTGSPLRCAWSAYNQSETKDTAAVLVPPDGALGGSHRSASWPRRDRGGSWKRHPRGSAVQDLEAAKPREEKPRVSFTEWAAAFTGAFVSSIARAIMLRRGTGRPWPAVVSNSTISEDERRSLDGPVLATGRQQRAAWTAYGGARAGSAPDSAANSDTSTDKPHEGDEGQGDVDGLQQGATRVSG